MAPEHHINPFLASWVLQNSAGLVGAAELWHSAEIFLFWGTNKRSLCPHLNSLTIANGFSRIENDSRKWTTNDTTKGLDGIGASSTGVGYLTVVDDPETSSSSDGISYWDSSLEHYHRLLMDIRKLLKTHSNHWSAVLKYCEWFSIHPYPSTSTATMCQIGSIREIICWRYWRDHHGDRIRRLYWWHTTHWGNLSQTMQHQSGAPTQVTRALRRYRQRRMRLWGWWPGPTRWPILTISTRSPSRWESQGPLRYAFCAVPCKLSGGGPRQP